MDVESLKTKYEENTAQAKVKELEQELSQPTRNKDMSSLSSDLSHYSQLSLQISQIQKAIIVTGKQIGRAHV